MSTLVDIGGEEELFIIHNRGVVPGVGCVCVLFPPDTAVEYSIVPKFVFFVLSRQRSGYFVRYDRLTDS